MKEFVDTLTYAEREGSFVLSGFLSHGHVDPLDAQLLKAQQIPHLPKLKLQIHDGMVSCEYDLGRRKPLREWLRLNALHEDQALYLLFHVTNTLHQLRNYLLIENRCLLSVDQMFIADQPSDVWLIYCPDQRILAAEHELALHVQRLCLDLTKLGSTDMRLIRQIVDYCADPLFNLSSLRKKLLTWIELQDQPTERDSASRATASANFRSRLIERLQNIRTNKGKSKSSTISTPADPQELNNRTIPLRAKSVHGAQLKDGYLEVQLPEQGLHRIEIRRLPFVIGRDRGTADWVLDDVKISRLHAEIRMTGSGPAIRDLGSSNGTFVNGERAVPYTDYPLKSGDRIELGHIPCTYRYGSD